MPITLPSFGQISLWVAIVIAVIVGPFTAGAQEQVFSDYNCAITPPAGWIPRTNRVTTAAGAFSMNFSAPDRSRALLLIVQNESRPNGPLDSIFVASYERSVQQREGGKPISTRFMEIDGLKAYERISARVINGKNASTVRHLILTDSNIYTVEGMRNDAPVMEDTEIQSALASFHFITRPQPPILTEQAAAYRVGYLIGKYGVFAGLGVGAIVVIIVFLVRNSGRNSSRPPPPPPM